MALTALYMRKGGAEDLFVDADTHSVPVSSTTNRNVTGLAAYFLRIDGSNSGTGPWTTDDVMTASYFVATHASTASTLPVVTVGTTLNVVDASTFQVDATSLDCAVAANFTAKITGTGGGEINTLTVGTPPSGSEVFRCASARMGPTALTDSLSVAGATTLAATVIGGAAVCSTTLTVTGTTAHTGAVALNGGATVPSGQTLTINSGGTLAVNGTFTLATLVATATATIAGASGGSEVLRTTTFRATGTSALVGEVTMSGALNVGGISTFNSNVTFDKNVSVGAAGGITNLGIANYFVLPDTGDTSTATSLNLDALETPHSALFDPSGARTLASNGVTGSHSGVYWFINTGANAVAIHSDQMDTPTGTFTLAANTTALLYWDSVAKKFTQIAH